MSEEQEKNERIEKQINLDNKINSLSIFMSNFDEKEIHAFFYKQREKIAKDYSSSFLNEDDLKAWFINKLSKWFNIYPDIDGTTEKHGKSIKTKADFIIQFKPELTNIGLQGFLGIEVKYINPNKDFCGKSSKMVFQTLSYSYSDTTWNIKEINQKVKTEAFLIFTNISFKSEREKLFKTYDRFYDIYWKSMLSVANHADVGELIINNSKEYLNSWYMHFSGGNYCSWNNSKGFTLDNKNVVGKKKIGNIG